LDVATHGDPKFTGEMGWAAKVEGTRSEFDKRISEANEVMVSRCCYRAEEREG
jgi:hypothetical protein